MGTLANSEDPDEMQHNVAFHEVLHCFLRLKQSSWTKENSTRDPLKYTMGSPIRNPSEYKGLRQDTNTY